MPAPPSGSSCARATPPRCSSTPTAPVSTTAARTPPPAGPSCSARASPARTTTTPYGRACYERLEAESPPGEVHPQTSNRAELRAVIAALCARHWQGGTGITTLVIATDSEHVVKGATEGARPWDRTGWVGGGAPVRNKNLWIRLINEAESHFYLGLRVEFWRVPRRFVSLAGSAAKEASRYDFCAPTWEDKIIEPSDDEDDYEYW